MDYFGTFQPPDNLSLPKLLILVLRMSTRKINLNYCGYDIIFRFPGESFMHLLHRCIIAKFYQTLSDNLVYIITVTSNKSSLNKILVMRDSATYLTNSEISILFTRSAIKHSIPEELSIPLPAKESPRS